MRTPRRLAVASAVLGGGLLLAGPAAAQEVDCDTYPDLAECPIEGVVDAPAQDDDEDVEDTTETAGGSPSGGSSDGATSLPFTGGEVTLIALAGAAAVGGGIALTAAGRQRSSV